MYKKIQGIFFLSPWKPFRSISQTVQFHSKPLLWKESKVNPTFSLLTSSLNINVHSFVNQGLSGYLLLHMQNLPVTEGEVTGENGSLTKTANLLLHIFLWIAFFPYMKIRFLSFFPPHPFKRFQRLLNRIDSNDCMEFIWSVAKVLSNFSVSSFCNMSSPSRNSTLNTHLVKANAHPH